MVELYTDTIKAFILHMPEKFISSTFFIPLMKKCVAVIEKPEPADVSVLLQVQRYTAIFLLASLHPAFDPGYQHLVTLDEHTQQFLDAWIPANEFTKPSSGLQLESIEK